MLRVDCYDFYKLATQLRPLASLDDGVAFGDIWITLFTAKMELDGFFRIFSLKTSLAPARELYQALTGLVPDDLNTMETTLPNGNPRLIPFEIGRIKTLVAQFETVLRAELSGWDTFWVSKKGGFDTSDLINNAENILPEKVQNHLSNEAREDVRQAGRSLAFNMGTAAAFHMVRATETFIWKYYNAVVGYFPPVKMRNWGVYASNLKKCGKADKKVIDWIEKIKDEYRNPVLHPDKEVLPDDALEFIYACIALMSNIVTAMPSKPASVLLGVGQP